jgi:Arm DNA-binding domain
MAASNLSARAIARHVYNPGGSGRQVLWDRKVTGLGVRALASGRRVYVLSYRYQGRSRFMHLGRVADFRDVAEAREVAAEHLRRLRREQLDPLAERRRERAAGTLSQLFEQWLAQVARRRSPRTLADYRRCVDRYLVRAIGALRPAALTRVEVRRLHASSPSRPDP